MNQRTDWPRDYIEDDGTLLPGFPEAGSRKEQTLGDWLAAIEKRSRAPFQPMWDEAIRRVKARRFHSLKALGEHYGKSARWATQLRDVAIKQKIFTTEQWVACFRRKRKKKR